MTLSQLLINRVQSTHKDATAEAHPSSLTGVNHSLFIHQITIFPTPQSKYDLWTGMKRKRVKGYSLSELQVVWF